MPGRYSIRDVYTRENTLCKNFGTKERGGRLLEGGVFSGTYGIYSWAIVTKFIISGYILAHASGWYF